MKIKEIVLEVALPPLLGSPNDNELGTRTALTNFYVKHSIGTKNQISNISGGSPGEGREGRMPPSGGPNSFNFMLAPPPRGVGAPSYEKSWIRP